LKAAPARGERRAVIDIGTNAVKVLVGDVLSGDVTPVAERNEQTRLGRGFYQDKMLRPEAVEATARAVAEFACFARESGAESIRVIATSAVREARNRIDLEQAVVRGSGLPVEVISGDTEARLAFLGVSRFSGLGSGPMLIIDAGGGSTEFILGCGGKCLFRQSHPLGAVRMMEAALFADPPGAAARRACLAGTLEFLRRLVHPGIEPFVHLNPPEFLVGTGGSAAIMARIQDGIADYDRERIEAARLTLAGVREQTNRLWGTPLAERRRLPGLPPDRADIILPGAIIYEAVMESFGLEELRVSTRGLRFAALLESV
jgi:exopolyphosphatase/guanosine-5'-triphosphate,3'-diphosphate pyrophosphatase